MLEDLTFAKDGAALFPAALSSDLLQNIETTIAKLPSDQAGIRLHGITELAPLLASHGPVGRFVATILGNQCHPVRALLFDKTPVTNWSFAWHQDRTIAVKQRVKVNGFGPWSIKSGMQHVEPPFEILGKMVTVRVHLDDVPATNAPLLIAPGSHKLGRIPEKKIHEVVEKCGIVACLAKAGDIWLYSTPILHASESASDPTHRRVLQIDYAVGQLPEGLEWLGI